MSLIADQAKAYVQDSVLLLRKEIQLAKAETADKIKQAQSGLIMVVSGLLFLFVALFFLAQAAKIYLANFMDPALATLVTGAALAVIGLAVAVIGKSRLSPESLTPDRTVNAVKNSIHAAKSQAQSDAHMHGQTDVRTAA